MARHGTAIAAGLLLSSMGVLPAPAGNERTEQLFWQCTGRVEKLPELGILRCAAYLDGIIDMHSMSVGLSKAAPIFCAPAAGISLDQAMRIFTRWVEKNPNQMHESARLSVLIALREAFPCKGSR